MPDVLLLLTIFNRAFYDRYLVSTAVANGFCHLKKVTRASVRRRLYTLVVVLVFSVRNCAAWMSFNVDHP